MGLDILDKVRHPGNPPIQIREDGENLQNRRLKFTELRPRETDRFRADLALVRDQPVPGAFEGSNLLAIKDGSFGKVFGP